MILMAKSNVNKNRKEFQNYISFENRSGIQEEWSPKTVSSPQAIDNSSQNSPNR